jgi:hypothetical protein
MTIPLRDADRIRVTPWSAPGSSCPGCLYLGHRTDDGKKVALEAGGVATREEGSPVLMLREHVSLMTNHPELSWVNLIEVWARGVVDVSTGQVRVEAYGV